jgi:hypothetical protein
MNQSSTRFADAANQNFLAQNQQFQPASQSSMPQSSSSPSQTLSDASSDNMTSHQQNDFFRQLALLNKIYKEENKFSDTDSNFDMKVMTFYDKCRRARLPSQAYIQDASIMLSSQALSHYYINQMSYT